jgi:hypothetical protein
VSEFSKRVVYMQYPESVVNKVALLVELSIFCVLVVLINESFIPNTDSFPI